MILSDGNRPSEESLRRMAEAGVTLIDDPVREIEQLDSGVTCVVADGRGHGFDVLYSALGVIPRTSLASEAGAELTTEGRVIVDDHMQTAVAGLYAAGDVVRGLNQVAVAYAEAAIAAVAVHNRLPRNFA